MRNSLFVLMSLFLISTSNQVLAFTESDVSALEWAASARKCRTSAINYLCEVWQNNQDPDSASQPTIQLDPQAKAKLLEELDCHGIITHIEGNRFCAGYWGHSQKIRELLRDPEAEPSADEVTSSADIGMDKTLQQIEEEYPELFVEVNFGRDGKQPLWFVYVTYYDRYFYEHRFGFIEKMRDALKKWTAEAMAKLPVDANAPRCQQLHTAQNR